MFWVISVYFNIRNTLPKSGTFLLGHPVYVYIYISFQDLSQETGESTLHTLVSCTHARPHCTVTRPAGVEDQASNSTEQRPSGEANSLSAGQEIPRILWEHEGSLPCSQQLATCPYPEPDQSSPFPPSHFLKLHLNIILPYTPGPFKWSLSVKFPHQNPVYTSPLHHKCYRVRNAGAS